MIVVRLSRLTDESTSPERQLEVCKKLCEARGWSIVGVAEDLDVSAGNTSPFDRPSLSKWIGDGEGDPGRAHEYDAIVFYRVDRLVRRVRHLGEMITWSEKYAVNMVSATESHFDLSTPIGVVIAQLVASFAEMELEAISDRASSAHQHNIRLGKFVGGSPPFGYVAKETTDGTGWRVVPDPEMTQVIREIAERVLNGEPLRRISDDLNARGVLTPRDRLRINKGQKPMGFQWHSNSLKRRLTSPAMLGYAITREQLLDARGKPVVNKRGEKEYGPDQILIGSDGLPVQRAEPILTKPLFERLRAELEHRAVRKEPNKRTNSLLLRVLFCSVCGGPVYRAKGNGGRSNRYRCGTVQTPNKCGNGSVLEHVMDDAVEDQLLALMGDSERLQRVWDAGEDTAEELAEVEARLADRTSLLGIGAYKSGTPQRATLAALIDADAKLYDQLAATTTRPAGWTWQPTGETFRDWWGRQSVPERNIYLRTMGVEAWYDTREEFKFRLEFGALNKMSAGLQTVGPIETMTDAFVNMAEHGIAGIEIRGRKVVAVSKSGERVELPLDITEE
ncbi:site-specific DNA recombinase [Rhodococcus sp. OK519]|nr:site-specific DNA recombinase [Rhodococcus sp. OK519]